MGVITASYGTVIPDMSRSLADPIYSFHANFDVFKGGETSERVLGGPDSHNLPMSKGWVVVSLMTTSESSTIGIVDEAGVVHRSSREMTEHFEGCDRASPISCEGAWPLDGMFSMV